MKTFPSLRKHSARRWVPAGSIIITLAVAALVAALVPRALGEILPSALLTLGIIALCLAITLHVRFLTFARRAHDETTRVLDSTEREFQSIFDNALDAIVILDDCGICLEANPAALTLFKTKRPEFVGHPIQGFFSPAGDSKNRGDPLPGGNIEHGEIEIVPRHGKTLFVEFTVKANYLPGRHAVVLRNISPRREAEMALRESDERFRQIADNIQEIFWMIDASSKQVIFVNKAFETLTGRSASSLRENPTSYQELFHPQDRVRVLTRLEEAACSGQIDEEFRIIRADHAVRWVSVHGFPARDSTGTVQRLVGTAQDITARKNAEQQMSTNLARAESASAEADAFRKTTLALTQNLRMDYVLDTLLQSLLNLVPCESARILLLETDTHLFLAREMQHSESTRRLPKCPATLDARNNRFLLQAIVTKTAVLLANSSTESEWQAFNGFSHMRSWLCVPLLASQKVLGLLSLGDSRAQAFSLEHLRLAKSLAIPAAVAIQNARLFERAEIYGAELEQRLRDLEHAQNALRRAEEKLRTV
jgi:PAS domain S-box-containing protein